MNGMLFAFAIYLLMLFAIAIWSMRGIHSTSDFLLGGRSIGPLGTAISAAASARSSSAVVGQAGLAFLMGFQAVWIVFMATVLEYLAMLYLLGPKLRRFSSRRGAITIPEYLEERFRDSRNLLRLLCAIALIVFMLAYIAAQYVGMSFVISQVLEWPLVPAIIAAAIFTALYTAFGGYKAVVYTDVMQGCIMVVALVIVPVMAWRAAGGLGNVYAELDAIGGSGLSGVIGSEGWPFAIGMLFAGLGAFGNPHIVVRYMSIKSVRDFRLAAIVNLIFNVIIGWGGIILGLAGRVLYRDISQLPFENQEMIFFAVSRDMVPWSFALGVIWAGVFAAMMSSADSMIIIVTSSVSRDIYEKVLRAGREIRDSTKVRIDRVTVLLVVVICLFLTFFLEKSALFIALFAWGGLGSALGPVLLLSLWWPRMTKSGAVAGLVGGIAMAVVWRFTPALTALVTYEALPAFLFALGAAWLVSLWTEAPSDPQLLDDLAFPEWDEMELDDELTAATPPAS